MTATGCLAIFKLYKILNLSCQRFIGCIREHHRMFYTDHGPACIIFCHRNLCFRPFCSHRYVIYRGKENIFVSDIPAVLKDTKILVYMTCLFIGQFHRTVRFKVCL